MRRRRRRILCDWLMEEWATMQSMTPRNRAAEQQRVRRGEIREDIDRWIDTGEGNDRRGDALGGEERLETSSRALQLVGEERTRRGADDEDAPSGVAEGGSEKGDGVALDLSGEVWVPLSDGAVLG